MNSRVERHAPVWQVALVSVGFIVLMLWLRFVIYPERIVPLTYALALLPSLWHRNRTIHWGLSLVFILMAMFKIHIAMPEELLSTATLWSFWAMQAINVLVVAAVVDAVNHYRSGLEAEQARLADANAELEASNEELAAREEEISRQNEELIQQTEELQQQSEELEAQGEELRAGNEELSKREETLQLLLDVSGPHENEEQCIRRICDLAPGLVGAGDAAAVFLRAGESMLLIAASGFGVREQSIAIPAGRSVASLIIERGETGFLEDISLRPDLELPPSGWDRPFSAVLICPMVVGSEYVGVLEIYSFNPRTWTGDQVRMMEWLARQCARVWETLRLHQERRQAEEALRQLNEDLERQVAERTALAEERAARLRALAAELAQTEQRERRRLAKLLHDHLQQNLIAAKLQANLLERHQSAADIGKTAQLIDELLREAIETSRTLTVELSPALLHDSGLTAGLEWLVRSFNDKHGLQVDLRIARGADSANEDVSVFVFEAVREMLFNVVKHAGVDRASVALEIEGNSMQVSVDDQGRGFTTDDKPLFNLAGFGLFGIQQRIESLGGTFSLFTAPGEGTRVHMRAPLAERAGGHAPEPRPRRQSDRAASRRSFAHQPQDGDGIRVLLVDDHAIVRQGLSMLLAREDGIAVIGEAADGEAALRSVRLLRPHVVVMDVAMPVMDGITATRQISVEFPEVRIIGLSMYEEEDRADAMLQAGARIYLNKDGPSQNLISAIRHYGTLVSSVSGVSGSDRDNCCTEST
jgi:signal transduction histidine kinase/ActR/RegA family two-component response regulator